MNVLAVDTAGPVAGVALWSGDDVRVRTERVVRGSERRLVPWIAELLDEAGLTAPMLDGVAAGAGPGAFTGLRVGLATAAGLAQAVGCALWTTSSLRIRALAVPHGPAPVLAMLDARKGRVYAGRWHGEESVGAEADVAPEVALGWVDGAFRATGEGALVYAAEVVAAGGVLVDEAADPGVAVLARLGIVAVAAGKGRDPAEVRPNYLRAPDAVPRKR